MNEEYIFDKFDMAKYIIYKYYEKTGKMITPLKLQKSLYFLFAVWGGKIRCGKNDEQSEFDVANFHDYLFSPIFLAWKYGPVEKDVYNEYKNVNSYEEIKEKTISELNASNNISLTEKDMAIDFIDGYLIRVFNTSDFALVDLSHKDNCWKNTRMRDNTPIDNIIDNEDILNEYATRYS